MLNVSENDQLFKVHRFRRERNGKDIVWIDVYEHLNAKEGGLFYALPVDLPLPLSPAKEEFRTTGKSLEDALNSCLAALKGVENSEILEKSKE